MTTMKELLDIPRFSDLKVINASANLSLTVKSIEISETPDVALYIPKHALLLTTAMSYKDNQQDLITLIDSLKRVDSAGIGIKVGRFLGELDQAVIDYANSVEFPLIQIPNTTPLGTLSHQLLNYLWNTKTEQMSFALDIQKRFSNLLMNDASVARFIADFGKMIKTPVILLDPFQEVIAQSKDFTRSSKIAEYYVEQVLLKKPQLLDNETDSFLINGIEGHEIQISIYPIKANNYFPYFLIILKPEQIPYPISEFAVDQACMVLSFVLYKNLKVEESLQNLGGDYFAQLIESQQLSENKTKNWLDSGLNFGIINSNFYQVIYIHCQHDYQNEWKKQYNREKIQLASNWLLDKLIPYFRDAQIFHIKNNNHLALLLQSKYDYEYLEEILEKTAADLEKILPISLVFSFGHAYNKIEMISNSFVEAKMSFEEVFGKNHQQRIHYYQSRGMQNLFEKLQTDEIHYFCQATLKELAYPKEESMVELRKTLETYLDYQCEITKTSKKLFIHRNTVKYRIDQCEKILGTPINDPNFSLNLRLALTLSQSHLNG
ncbi:PucR family transcriptional regulator [Bacillus sp. B15-48]|uniref:PucR family transcriptional regulator n=1 Tax=Bacillus sp. B15-48 TaxID=1548601 RepID=UPI00193F6CB3|nr:PucR family transcriptional regulator [Bacillus sp. B15-48]MBM4761323.1 PucR family transcriptional regulator [Bacillus sp. B15-48]